MRMRCARCSTDFVIADVEFDFYARVSPLVGGKRLTVPPPTLCQYCREQRRMCWRNERSLYSRRCDKTGRSLISAFPPGTPFPVYDTIEWWKEDNNALVHGRDFDFNRPFFDQIADLMAVVPRGHTFNYADDRLENSRYTNCAGDLKDCYLCFGAGPAERCCYCTYIVDCYLCFDCFFAVKSRNCCECVDVVNCDSVFYAQSSNESHDCWHLYDCRGCSDCFACVGLRRKRYHLLNENLGRERYLREKERLLGDPAARAAVVLRFEQLKKSWPRRCCSGDHNENVVGDVISSSRNCWCCFDTHNAEDCRYCTWFVNGKDCMDYLAGGEAELCYEVAAGGQDTYRSLFTAQSYGGRECLYTDLCMYCKDCFGCVGLKNEQYCILNKRWSEEEYRQLMGRIVEHMMRTGEWGEFFPPRIAPHGYNETIAAEYYPLEREEALRQGFRWLDYRPPPPAVARTIRAAELPRSVEELPDDILRCGVLCEATGKPFRLIREELDFRRANRLAPPRRHPEQRHAERRALRNPRRIWERCCDGCGKRIFSSYDPQRPQQVYCEECYLARLP